MDKLDLILEKLDTMEKQMGTMQEDISTIKEDLAELKEAHDETRGGVNSLLEWADTVSVLVKVPLNPAQ